MYELIETNPSTNSSYPKLLILSTGKRMHYRQVGLVLQYHAPNEFKDPESYTHHLLFMFYPFDDECELKLGLHEKCSNTEFLLVRIFPYLD